MIKNYDKEDQSTINFPLDSTFHTEPQESKSVAVSLLCDKKTQSTQKEHHREERVKSEQSISNLPMSY